jgi:adenylate cyclase
VPNGKIKSPPANKIGEGKFPFGVGFTERLAQEVTVEAPELERRLAAIVAADVEGYSRLMHRDEETTMATLSARRAVIDDLIVRHRGRIANTAGDSVLAEFASVLDAVTSAVAVQHAMAAADAADPDQAMRFRIGINVGDVMVKDGDIFGDGVNVAARLESLAEGGGICVSRGVRDHLRNRENFAFEDLGEQLVKNIAHPVRAFRLRIGDTQQAQPSEVDAPEALFAPEEHNGSDEVNLEMALWDSVKDGSPEELASYLEHYPEGTFASLARTRQVTPAEAGHAEERDADLDAAFWEAIKDTQTEEELSAYLDQHPDGHFSALARARIGQSDPALARADAQSEAGEQAIDLAFWDAVSDTDDPALLKAYLKKFPDGEFAILARARLAGL